MTIPLRRIIIVASPLLAIAQLFAQNPASNAPSDTAVDQNGSAMATEERVIVTGSNIPTAEEVGHNPVDTYRRDDITRLGVRTPSDLIQKIPAATGFGVSENNTNGAPQREGGAALIDNPQCEVGRVTDH